MSKVDSTCEKETDARELTDIGSLRIVDDGNENEITEANEDNMLKGSVLDDDGDAEDETKSFYQRFRADKLFRLQVLHTFCVALAGVGVCWYITIIGVALPDIMLIIDKDLATSSWILAAWSVGHFFGAISVGPLYDRYNKLLVLLGVIMGIAVLSVLTPWCVTFTAMLIIHFIGGMFAIAGHSVCTADMLYVWGKKESGRYLLMVYFAISLGGAIGPLVSEPFLAKRITEHTEDVAATNNSIFDSTTRAFGLFTERSALVNNSSEDINLTHASDGHILTGLNLSPPISNQSTNYTSETTTYGETRIVIAYTLLSAFCTLVVVLFVVLTFTHGNLYKMKKSRQQAESHKEATKQKMSKLKVAVFVILQALLIALYVTIQKHLTGFFMAFVISELQWSKSAGSNATALFWIAFGVNRLLAVFALQRWKQQVLFIAYTGTFTVGVAAFIVFSVLNIVPCAFISLAIWGFGMSPLLAFMFTWLSKNVTEVTGKITSVVYALIALSGIVSPVISAYLMETFSYDWFLHINVIYTVSFILLYVFIQILYKVLSK